MVATDFPTIKGTSDVIAETMKRIGMNVDYQATDFGTVVQRRVSKKPPAEGGWNALCSFSTSSDFFTPATHYMLRSNGEHAMYGWPSSPRLEELRDAWFDEPDLAGQKKLAAEMQTQAFVDVPYIPLGAFYNPSVYRRDIIDILHGFPIFWNMRRV
jgi:peptide/nickel transport system substrate-binding protein